MDMEVGGVANMNLGLTAGPIPNMQLAGKVTDVVNTYARKKIREKQMADAQARADAEDALTPKPPPPPPPPLLIPWVEIQDIGRINQCDTRWAAYTPCMVYCEHSCQVTVNFPNRDECRKGESIIIWRGTCKDNFEKAKDNVPHAVYGCTNFDIYWEDNPFDSGAGMKRTLMLKKKAYGDYYKFGVTGCDRKKVTPEFYACKAGGEGSCTGKMESFRSGWTHPVHNAKV